MYSDVVVSETNRLNIFAHQPMKLKEMLSLLSPQPRREASAPRISKGAPEPQTFSAPPRAPAAQ